VLVAVPDMISRTSSIVGLNAVFPVHATAQAAEAAWKPPADRLHPVAGPVPPGLTPSPRSSHSTMGFSDTAAPRPRRRRSAVLRTARLRPERDGHGPKGLRGSSWGGHSRSSGRVAPGRGGDDAGRTAGAVREASSRCGPGGPRPASADRPLPAAASTDRPAGSSPGPRGRPAFGTAAGQEPVMWSNPPSTRWQLLRTPAPGAQPRPRVPGNVQRVLRIEQGRALRRFLAVRRVQHTAGRAPPLAHLRRHPPRRPAPPWLGVQERQDDRRGE
jgi:hypothetical protein